MCLQPAAAHKQTWQHGVAAAGSARGAAGTHPQSRGTKAEAQAQPRVPAMTVTGRGVSAQPVVGHGQEAAPVPGPSTAHTAQPDATGDGDWIPARAALLLRGSPKPPGSQPSPAPGTHLPARPGGRQENITPLLRPVRGLKATTRNAGLPQDSLSLA